MTAIILPPTGGGGVTIYPDPSALPAIAEVGQIAAVASDVTVRQWDGAAWAIRGSASTPASVSDTNSVDLTVTLGVLTADLKLSASAPDAGFQPVTLSIETDGLQGQVANTAIRGTLSATAPLSYNATTGDFSIANQAANLILSGPVSGGPAAPTFRGLIVADIPTGIDHGNLAGLADDDHTQYALLAGRSGGQSLIGGTAASNNLNLQSTSDATRGSVVSLDTFVAQLALRKSPNTTNTSMVSGVAAGAAFPSVTDLQTATVTLESQSNSFAFVVSLSTGESIEFHASQATAEISAVSDPSNLFLLTDAGTGIFVSKSAASSVISIKNRMGGSRNIGVSFLSGHVSAATSWA